MQEISGPEKAKGQINSALFYFLVNRARSASERIQALTVDTASRINVSMRNNARPLQRSAGCKAGRRSEYAWQAPQKVIYVALQYACFDPLFPILIPNTSYWFVEYLCLISLASPISQSTHQERRRRHGSDIFLSCRTNLVTAMFLGFIEGLVGSKRQHGRVAARAGNHG